MKKVLIFLSFSVFLFSAPYNENEMLVRRFYEKYNYIQEYEKEKHNEDIPRNELYLRMGIFYLFQKENDKEAEKYFFKSLNEDKNLDITKANEILSSPVSEKAISLEKKIPIHIVYLTSWVDENGVLQFREDIYNFDKTQKELLF